MRNLDSRDAVLNLSASDIHNLYQPSKCNLRVYLLAKGEPQAEQGDFSAMLMELGKRHEAQYLETLGDYVQPEGRTLDEKWADTQRLVNELTPVIYQPVLIADAPPELGNHRVVGIRIVGRELLYDHRAPVSVSCRSSSTKRAISLTATSRRLPRRNAGNRPVAISFSHA